MTETATDSGVQLVDTDSSDIRFREALSDLFADDGTVYIVSGYFTYQGYRAIREDIISFLERSRENKLIAVVSPAADQFSPQIAHDLWEIDDNEQVQIYKQPRGLHAKLYIRDGPNPTCILGSANITQVAFKYNTEINVKITRDSIDHPDLKQFHDWMVELVEESEPLRRRDLIALFQVSDTVVNWSNKARYLPKRNVALRAGPVLLVIFLVSGLFSLLFRLV
jgi:hypothetical protein